jgi:hypothetical protein
MDGGNRPTRRPPGASDLHLLACLVLRCDLGVVPGASSASIAARIHSRAMSISLSRSSGLLACVASLAQSRANSSNSDPGDMGASVQVPFVASNNAISLHRFHCGLDRFMNPRPARAGSQGKPRHLENLTWRPLFQEPDTSLRYWGESGDGRCGSPLPRSACCGE